MADFAWIGEQEALTNEALTVRAQTVDPTDGGRLLWDVFFPREDVDSVKLSEMTTIDYRPTADRREWNQRGRLIPLKTPPLKELEMVPIEAYFTIGEREMQHLAEQTRGNEALFQEIVGNQIPRRTDSLVSADYRRIEIEVFEAWALGQITAYNPQHDTNQVMDFGFAAARYTTAGTAWDDAGVNAYDLLIAWLEAGIVLIGGFEGVVLRQATYNAIRADAPNSFIPDIALGVQVTRLQLEQRISDDLGQAFRFTILENTVETFDDAGITTSATKIWPAQMVAAIPVGTVVGATKFAPVRRAMEMAAQVPGAGIDIRGCTVYAEEQNQGRMLTVEAQVNALPVPNEQNLYVIDAGV